MFPKPELISTTETRIKLTPVSESEKPQLQRFCNACKGIPQVTHSAFPFNNQASVVGPPQTTPEDPELALAITASLQSSSAVGPTAPNTYHGSSSSTPSGSTNPTTHNIDNNKKTQCEIEDVGTSSTPISYHPHSDTNTYSQIVPTAPMNIDAPSAPPLPDIVDDGPIHYPSIDSTDIDLSEKENNNNNNNNDSSSCVICLDAPVEGACIPCGHMAGCMTCLNEIKSKNWGCPVCRTKIDQVIRLYAV
ncbi:putative transcription factor C2H2 family [Helianthus annuus]|nr:putative transcription factor C2H2 family [Helianthus annuus]